MTLKKAAKNFPDCPSITIKRRSGYYVYKIFMPLGILTFTSIFFLAIPINAFADRMAFISGLLFTTLAYQIIIASSVPRVPYLTLGDTYTIFLFAFMISEVLLLITSRRTYKGKAANGCLDRKGDGNLLTAHLRFITDSFRLACNRLKACLLSVEHRHSTNHAVL